MRTRTYLFGSWLALFGGLSIGLITGCGSNKSLGDGEPGDAAVASGGTTGATSVTTVTAGTTATSDAGGASAVSSSAGGASASAGITASAGQASTGGKTATGGSTGLASTGGSTMAAGNTAVAGQTSIGGSLIAGTSAIGGSSTGGTSAGGNTGAAGVILSAAVNDKGNIEATWQNNTQASIFLYGCGTVDVYRKEASGWTNLGKGFACTWEGVSPEVKAGASSVDPGYGPVYKLWGGTGGTFRVAGKYGVGCTNPSAGQSKAGCTAFYEATSNEVTVVAPPVSSDAGAADLWP